MKFTSVRVALVLTALACFVSVEEGCGADGHVQAAPPLRAAPPRRETVHRAASGNDGGATTTISTPQIRDVARCQSAADVHLFVSPSVPVIGTPLHILAVTDSPLVAGLIVKATTAKDEPGARSAVRHGGPPYFWVVEVPAPSAENYTAKLVQDGCDADENVASRTVTVSFAAPPASPDAKGAVWPTRAAWSRDFENVYSAWIETLFDAPEGAMPSWSALDELLRDRTRNFLFDYLGAGEDSFDPPPVRPDCADLPYFLRAYFAFKLKLPFGVSKCDRGGSGIPPRCRASITTNEDPPSTHDAKATAVQNFGTFLHETVAYRAHSGSGRIPRDDENSDYYPVPLTWESLRPGTIYADPYGHVLVIAKRLPQNAQRGGVLLAVDAQPDGMVRRKRFWRGNFLYANEPELGGPGWKRFRPLSQIDGKLVRWADGDIRTSNDYGDVAQELAPPNAEAFFDAMEDVLAPRPLDPWRATLEVIDALEEQIRTRVDSVDSGREWLETARTPAVMPGLLALFETTGTWEDFSTPSRDLRLLAALDFVAGFPAHVARRPSRYAIAEGKSATDLEKELDALVARELSSRKISYPRTDGSSFTLSLADVLARKTELEVAYNPNDCAEVRWGAPVGSEEQKTCHARAPVAQQQRMEELRVWFRERRRPPRR